MPKRPSLTEIHRPEYDRIVKTIIGMGLAHATWRGPEFKVRRTSRHCSVTGRGCPLQVSLQIGTGAPLWEIHETMVHELAHAISYHETEDHGRHHREVLRAIVRAHWPSIRPWQQINAVGWRACYAEDDEITKAISDLYLANTRSARTEHYDHR